MQSTRHTPFLVASFASLMQFVKKNTALAHSIQAIQHHSAEIAQLKQAIIGADFQHPIFSHAHCYLYLLYLMKDEQINFWQGITLYFYLIALAEFTDRKPIPLPIRIEDAPRSVDMIALLDATGMLSKLGEKYIEHVVAHIQSSEDITLTKDTIIARLNSMPRSEQYLQVISDQQDKQGLSTIIQQIVQIDPKYSQLALLFNFQPDEQHFTVPSLTFINFIFQQISRLPITLLPMFGSVSSQTLIELHTANLHPVALFCPNVKSNYTTVHDYLSSPFGIAWHDLVHALWFNLFAVGARHLILTTIIPDLILFRDNQQYTTKKQAEVINKIIKHLNDFDLLYAVFKHKKTRLADYLTVQSRPQHKIIFYHTLKDAISFYSLYVRLCRARISNYHLANIMPIHEKILDTYSPLRDLIEKFHGDENRVNTEIVNLDYIQPEIYPADLTNLLFQAIDAEAWDDVKNLIAQGANINALNEWGNAPFHTAIDRKQWSNLKILLDLGADINLPNRAYMTGFDVAWEFAKINVNIYASIIFLIDRGATYTDKLEKNKTLLDLYITYPSIFKDTNLTSIVRLFVDLQDDLRVAWSSPSNAKQTLFDIACSEFRFDVILIIYQYCPNFIIQEKINHTALYFASIQRNFPALAIFLIQKDLVNVNALDEDGNTGLHLAAQLSMIELVNALIQAGIDIGKKNARAKSACDVASRKVIHLLSASSQYVSHLPFFKQSDTKKNPQANEYLANKKIFSLT